MQQDKAIFLLVGIVILVSIFIVTTKNKGKKKKNSLLAISANNIGSTDQPTTPIQSSPAFKTIHDIATATQYMRSIRTALIQYYLPNHYDTRIKYGRQNIPNSSGIVGCISDPMDQGNCGSSWAFAAAGVISDRLRIQSSVPSSLGMVLKHDNLSPSYLMLEGNQCTQLRVLMKGQEDILCDPHAICQYGAPILAFKFVKENGCVGERNEAAPYDPRVDLYKIREFYTSSLDIAGEMNYYFFPGQKSIRAETRWVYLESNKNSMKEMMERGPLLACMNIYSDFLEKYKFGVKNDDVYYQPPGSIPRQGFQTPEGIYYVGTQAVSIIGWGEKKVYSETIPYWIVRFTWGSEWNGDGYAKIMRGQNCCNLELEMLGCWGYDIISSIPTNQPQPEPNDVTTMRMIKSPHALLDA